MPVVVEEKLESRELTAGDSATAELLYTIRGTADDAEAQSELASVSPLYHSGLPRKTLRVSPVFVDVNNPDGCIWDGTVSYARDVRPETGESVFSFDTGGGTQHITQSLATVGKHAAPGQAAPDFGGAIGVTRDSVEGVDITVPVYNWTETHYLDDVYVTGSYKVTLFHLTGKVNQQTFRGFEPGEVLFLGASGSKRGEGDWEITFRFAASPNRWNLAVGQIAGIRKRGWEYLWVRYVDDEDEGVLVKRPAAVYVEQVYEYGDFRRLGIGT